MKPIGWRFWVLTAVLVLAYGLLGMVYADDGRVETDLYQGGTVAVSVSALVFIVTYTLLGLTGPAKWWKYDAGTALVLGVAGLLPITVPLSWVFLFDHGHLTSNWLAWVEVGGPCFTAVLYAWLCSIWLRNARTSGKREDDPATSSRGTLDPSDQKGDPDGFQDHPRS